MSSESDPGRELFKLAKAQAMPKGICRALLVGTAGTANFKDAAGNDCANVPLQAGWNPIGISALQAGGSADDIWAAY